MCKTEYMLKFESKDKLTEKAMENLKTIVVYASKSVGVEIEIKQIKEDKPFEFGGRVSEAP